MSFQCDYCKNTFTSRGNLDTHQKKALYCIEKRGGSVISEKFSCDECKKEFTEKRYLQKHQEKCNISKKYQDSIELITKQADEIVDLKKQSKYYLELIKELKLQNSVLIANLKDVAVQGVKKSTTTTNNIVNIENLTDEWLKTSSKNLTLDHIQRGPPGYAEFASQHSLKDRVKCVDFARKILQYKEDDGLVRDKKGKKLSKKFFESIETQNNELIRDAMSNIREEMDDKTPEEMDSLMEKMNVFLEMNLIELSKNDELKESFVKELCELL
jgi:hypothetical protein